MSLACFIKSRLKISCCENIVLGLLSFCKLYNYLKQILKMYFYRIFGPLTLVFFLIPKYVYQLCCVCLKPLQGFFPQKHWNGIILAIVPVHAVSMIKTHKTWFLDLLFKHFLNFVGVLMRRLTYLFDYFY